MMQQKPFDQNSSLGTVLSASYDENIFKLPFKLLQKSRNMRRSTLNESNSDVNHADEVLNYWNLAKELKVKAERLVDSDLLS